MTKEELEKEAEEWLCNNLHSASEEDFVRAMVDFAEPREKRIAELEHQLTHRNCVDCSNHSSKLRMRTLELEKENAELKEKLGDVQMQKAGEKSDLVWKLMTANEQKANQLTKATEIIKKLYAVYYDPCVTESDLKYRNELFAEIKQFISEVEK